MNNLALNPFHSGGRWFKGCLHCHTTNSDGALTPFDVSRAYDKNGYDFVAFTDHGKVTKLAQGYGEVLLLRGEELSVGASRAGESYHIVAVGIEDELKEECMAGPEAVQKTIDAIVEGGGLAFVAHPYWSGLLPEDIIKVNNYFGIEIFNTGCEAEVGKGFSTVHWDQVLSLGEMINGIAVDDAHRYIHPPHDAFGGWVWVKADELIWESISEAIREGLFYSSMGPKISLLELDGRLKVRCSGAKQVSMISRNGTGIVLDYPTMKGIVEAWKVGENERMSGVISDVKVEEADGAVETQILLHNGRKLRVISSNDEIVEAECGLDFFSGYFRIEVIDRENRRAWTNPIPIK